MSWWSNNKSLLEGMSWWSNSKSFFSVPSPGGDVGWSNQHDMIQLYEDDSLPMAYDNIIKSVQDWSEEAFVSGSEVGWCDPMKVTSNFIHDHDHEGGESSPINFIHDHEGGESSPVNFIPDHEGGESSPINSDPCLFQTYNNRAMLAASLEDIRARLFSPSPSPSPRLFKQSQLTRKREDHKHEEKGTNNIKRPTRIETPSSTAAIKRPRIETPSSLPTFKVRKEKLGDRITALQQLVSPFGKTDTASVLHEAIEYIKFLHDQVNLLSNSYTHNNHQQQGLSNHNSKDDQHDLNLTNRGLCLVPISTTFPLAHQTPADLFLFFM